MSNQSGNTYGLTILSPIITDEKRDVCHANAIRAYLAALPRDHRSPFARVTSTHLCRLVVMDDVVYVGAPACEEHLQSSYLIFTSNLDGDLDSYLLRMAKEIPDTVDAVWSHCVGYPGIRDPQAFVEYMKKCQLTTTFFFADVNDKTVIQTLRALKVQAAVAKFIEVNQGKPAAQIQTAFRTLMENIDRAPDPVAGGHEPVMKHHTAAATAAPSESGHA